MVNVMNDFKVGKGDQIVGDGTKTYDIYVTVAPLTTVSGAIEGYIQ